MARQFVRSLGVSAEFVEKPPEAFNFADKRTLKAYLDGSRFTAISGMRFTPMSDVFRRFGRHASRLGAGPPAP
jgi:hypothetical protein